MSIERDIQTPSGDTLTLNQEERLLSRADELRKRQNKKVKMMQILDRGIVGDRLKVDIPNNLHPEWVPNDPMEIHRMQTVGFRFPSEEEYKNRGLHNQGDGKVIVGDVVLMVCDREDKEIIDEIRAEQFEKMNGRPGEAKVQAEEKNFKSQLRHADRDNYIGTMEESDVKLSRKAEIEAALVAANTPAASPVTDPSIIR